MCGNSFGLRVCAWVGGAHAGDGANQRDVATQCEALGRRHRTHCKVEASRFDVGTPGADVFDSHWWGTTCPSAPTINCKPGSLDQLRSPRQ